MPIRLQRFPVPRIKTIASPLFYRVYLFPIVAQEFQVKISTADPADLSTA